MKKIYLLGIILIGCLCLVSIASATIGEPDINQVKIFKSCGSNAGEEIEKQVNKFLEEKRIHPSDIVDIKLSTTSVATSRFFSECTTIMVIYHRQ